MTNEKKNINFRQQLKTVNVKNYDWLLMSIAILKLKLLFKKTPIIVSWSLTNRCNSKCKYCFRWKQESVELNTKQIFSIIDELAEMGTRRIIFTGGEPLLREDIGEIIDYTAGKDINTIMSSNGRLISWKIREISKLKRVIFSFDGPEDVHDRLRGEGSHFKVLEAIRIAKSYGIEVGLAAVLSRMNLSSIDYILEAAAKFDVKVSFQPILMHLLDEENSKTVVPLESCYKKAIQELLIRKRKGNKYIKNSIRGLKHLLNWPEPKSIKCSGGLLSCRIDPEGYVSYCDKPQSKKLLNCLETGFKGAFDNLSPLVCGQCWCGVRVELNYLLQLNLNCIFNLVSIENRF